MASYIDIKAYKWGHTNLTYSLDPNNSFFHPFLFGISAPDWGNGLLAGKAMGV